jgi:hypothetical protein
MSIRREGNGNLRLWGIHGKRYYLDILYEDVLYSQINETNVRLHISLVEELTLDELSELRHNMGRNRMLREVPERFMGIIDALSREEYRIYAHYTIKENPDRTKVSTEERLVLARRVRIEGEEEWLGQRGEASQTYKFYAFVSHEEGGRDEKWARWLQHRLQNYRIPADAVLKLRREEKTDGEGTHVEPPPEQLSVSREKTPANLPSPANSARYLIVVCSPRGARSDRVDQDVRDFVKCRKEDSIIPFIIDGEVVESGEKRCYPPALSFDALGITLRDGSPEEALIKVMARLLRLKFSRLYQHHLRERRCFMVHALTVASILLFVVSGLTGWAVSKEIETARRQKEADGLAYFLVEDMRGESRLPEKVRAMIDEKLRAYRERYPKHSNSGGQRS